MSSSSLSHRHLRRAGWLCTAVLVGLAAGLVPAAFAGAPAAAPTPAAAPVPAGVPVPAGAPVPAGVPAPAGAPAPAAAAPAAGPVYVTPTEETHFVPLKPCRIADTRVNRQTLAANTGRIFYVAGGVGFAPQGGTAGGCGVPIGASAVALAVTTTNSASTGFLAGWATGTSESVSSFASLARGANISTNPVLPIAASSNPQLALKVHGGGTDVVLDVTGYYVPQIQGLVYTGTNSFTVYSGSPRVLSVTHISTGIADVTLDRAVDFCTVMTAPYYDRFYYTSAQAIAGPKVRIYSWSLDDNTHKAVYVDNYVWLNVVC
jgi:hypothetical protein